MTWAVPSVRDLVTETIRSFTAHLTGADAALAANNLHPVAKIIGGGLHPIHVGLEYAARQAFVATCDNEFLDRHGAQMKPTVPRKPAAKASGLVSVTSTTAITLATGAILTRSDGVSFVVDAGIVLASAGSATVSVTAVEAGAAGATSAASTLAAVSGLTGSATFAVDSGGLGGASDAESDEAYRSRLLFAKAFPEHAGSPPDWLCYTLAAPGVTRAFIDPLAAGRGTVVVYPFFDTTRANGIGLESDRLIVEQTLAIARPGAGMPIVRLPDAVPVDVVIDGLSSSTPDVQQAVVAELSFTFARQSRVAGISEPHRSMPWLATPQGFSRSWIWQAVANATGEERHTVTTPAADIALAEGQCAILGSVSFV